MDTGDETSGVCGDLTAIDQNNKSSMPEFILHYIIYSFHEVRMAESEKRSIDSVSGFSGDTSTVKRKRYNDTWFRLLFHQEVSTCNGLMGSDLIR